MKCETLDVWKFSCSLSSEIYLAMRECKDYGFRDQITRSGLSIPSNIAEGIERESDKESWRFLDIAQASSAELKTQIYIGMKIDYIDRETGNKWIDELENIAKMIGGLKRHYLSDKSTNVKRQTSNVEGGK